MDKFSYIKKITVSGLWDTVDMVWTLNRDVNVLSGRNGSGKSTIIRALVELFRDGKLSPGSGVAIRGISVTFEDGSTLSSSGEGRHTGYKVDSISTFDNRLTGGDDPAPRADVHLRTELDREIYRIQRRYVSWQLAQSRRIIALLKKGAGEAEIAAVTGHRERFFDMIDSLFAPTGKSIDRADDELSFDSPRGRISPYDLSSGEKQMLIILATVLVQDNDPHILVMDEPDMALHFDWQSTLIENVMVLNPNVQVIMSTHSPAVVMNGWMGHVTEIGDIMV